MRWIAVLALALALAFGCGEQKSYEQKSDEWKIDEWKIDEQPGDGQKSDEWKIDEQKSDCRMAAETFCENNHKDKDHGGDLENYPPYQRCVANSIERCEARSAG